MRLVKMWFTKSRRAQSDSDYETWIEQGVSPTLNAFDNTGESRATVLIIDGTRVDDVRIYEEPVQTLKKRMGTGGNNVPMMAIPIADQATRFNGNRDGKRDGKGNGLGIGEPGDPMNTLTNGDRHAVALGASTMQVRRLTVIECERLMGWPDNHTLHRADGKTNADSTRYKMCGNGVASPVARWIGEQIMKVNEDE